MIYDSWMGEIPTLSPTLKSHFLIVQSLLTEYKILEWSVSVNLNEFTLCVCPLSKVHFLDFPKSQTFMSPSSPHEISLFSKELNLTIRMHESWFPKILVLWLFIEKWSGNSVILIVKSLEQVAIALWLDDQSRQKIDFKWSLGIS